jgi:hypothetical protein
VNPKLVFGGEGVHDSVIPVAAAFGRTFGGASRHPQDRSNPQNLPPLVYRPVSPGNFGSFSGVG